MINKRLMKNLKSDFLMHASFLTTNIILLFQKDVNPYGYMDNWKKNNETSLPEKEHF